MYDSSSHDPGSDTMRQIFIPCRYLGLILAGILLTACQTIPTANHETQALAPLPALPVADATHYVVNAGLSDVRFLVYRAGALASFGHNHVIQAKDIRGDVYLADDFQTSGFSLTLPVVGFVVDDPKARSVGRPGLCQAAFRRRHRWHPQEHAGPGPPGRGALPRGQHPLGELAGAGLGPGCATVRIELHGVARDISVPISVERNGDSLSVHGSFELKQSDFGLKPFSALGGGLQVADSLRVRFHLVAQKAP